MVNINTDNTKIPVVKGVSYFLAHVPGLVRHGSKPSRELVHESSLLQPILDHLQTFDHAVAYPPNQVFIGNLDPDELLKIKSPWYQNAIPNASRWGEFGEMMPEEEFYGIMKICDEFNLTLFEDNFIQQITLILKKHPLITEDDIQKLGTGVPLEQIKKKLDEGDALPLHIHGDRLVGCIQRPVGGGADESIHGGYPGPGRRVAGPGRGASTGYDRASTAP